MNVHPGESWEETVQAVRTHIPAVKRGLCPDAPFGVGLRLSARACKQGAGREHELRQALNEVGAYAFTVNAFPYGAFHHTRVKENVYLPDWSDPERVEYTLNAANILAAVLPEGMEGSVSTVPLGYKYEPRLPRGRHQRAKFKEHLLETATGLENIHQQTGKLIHLGLEPEPDCILETTEETMSFFRDLFQHPQGAMICTYIGVCLDTCHVALQFEDPAWALRRYQSENIRISKIQLSAALEVPADQVCPDDLNPFDDGVYFHQVTSSSGSRWRDLPQWRSAPDPEAGLLRIHCHVPLDWPGSSSLRSTRHTLGPEFCEQVRQLDSPHLEVETYTFGVLPPSLSRQKSVAENMTDECAWALDYISSLNPADS
jgi:hypothetical protein